MNILFDEAVPGVLDPCPTISLSGATVDIAAEATEGHCHHGCPLCDEEALPERCPGFRLDLVWEN